MLSERDARLHYLQEGLKKNGEKPLYGLAVLKSFPALSDEDPKEDDDHWWSWEPETIRAMLLPWTPTNQQMDVIMAVASACAQSLASDAAHTHWNEPDVFGDLCVTLTHATPHHAFLAKPNWWQIGIGMYFLQKVSPYVSFEEDVFLYMALCCVDQGFVYVPSLPELLRAMRSITHDEADILAIHVEQAWANPDSRKAILRKTDPKDPLHIQIMRLEAARQTMQEWIKKNEAQTALLKGEKAL